MLIELMKEKTKIEKDLKEVKNKLRASENPIDQWEVIWILEGRLQEVEMKLQLYMEGHDV